MRKTIASEYVIPPTLRTKGSVIEPAGAGAGGVSRDTGTEGAA